MDLSYKKNIKNNMPILIEEIPGQSPSEYVEGIVRAILPQDDPNPNGIRVLLKTGEIGHAKDIPKSENSIDIIKKRLKNGENETVEFKSSFSYDLKLNKENKDLKKVLAIVSVSLMNSKGGFLYVGVDDDGNALGLKNDYVLNGPDKDQFEMKVRQSFSKILNLTVDEQQLMTFRFPVIEGMEICEIHITPSKKPIFLTSKSYVVKIDEKSQGREFEDFYVRKGNSHHLITKSGELYEYFHNRFSNKE